MISHRELCPISYDVEVQVMPCGVDLESRSHPDIKRLRDSILKEGHHIEG